MQMLFRLVSILWLLVPISVFSSHIHHPLNSTNPETVQRHLQSQIYSIKIKIPANFYQRILALIIQDPCTVPINRFYCEPLSSSYQIPIPIRKVHSITPSTEIILEYQGYFEKPISLDFTYLTQYLVLEYVYPSLTFSGTPTVTLTNLNLNRTPGWVSSYFYGYIRAQYTANIVIDILHDDDCVFWLNDVEYVRDEGSGRRSKRGPLVSMVKDEYYYFNATLKNSGGSAYGMWLSWNMTGSVAQITHEFLYYQIRFQGAPLALQDLKRNYYCEVVNGLKCQACHQLCASCSMGTTVGVCQGCVPNASLTSGGCYCNPGYSQNTRNLAECIRCPNLCRSCYSTGSGDIILCESCVGNAYLADDSRCYCKEGYYTEPNNQLDCIACPPLCTDCLDATICNDCVSNAELVGSECVCEAGYLQDTRYLNQCTECPDLCQTCNSEGSDEVCYACEENAHLESDVCLCDEGFYQDSNDLDKCTECPGLCNTCYVDTSKNIICTTCKENAVLSNGNCECSAGYLISSERIHECIPCSDNLCELCSRNDSGVEVCSNCANYAQIIEGKCECIDKFTEPIDNTGICVSCTGSLCVECIQENSIQTCTECVANAVVNNNSCECKAGYMEQSYSIGVCIACSDKLCDTCRIQEDKEVCDKCELNAELKDGRCVCKSGYIELMSNPGICSRCNDPLCGKCFEEDIKQMCEVCVENGVMVSGECRCGAGFVVGSDGASCVICNIEFCKLCDKAGCVECLSPRVLDRNGSCICPSDNYNTINNSCIPIPFTATVSSSTNSLTIIFSKPTSNPLTISDYSIDYNTSNLSSLLSSSISQLSSTSYNIIFSSPYRLETQSTILLTFRESVTDTISQTVSPRTYTAQVSFLSLSSCISVTSFNNCQSCSRSNPSLSSCDRCDTSCRCVSTSWQTCTEVVPSIESAIWNDDMLGFNMKFNIQILTTSFINNDCSQYFTSNSLSQLGTNSICTWSQDLQTLTVTIGINSTLTTGSISLRTNIIPSVYNSNKTYNNSNAESITVPRQYPSPIAVLNTPSIISDCNDLKADGSQSFGNRRRLSYEWAVTGDNAESISNINNLLRSESGSTLIVLNRFLSNLSTISITLTVRNVFGISHFTTARVSLTSQFVPEVVFQGGPEIKVLTTAAFSPQILLRWPVCKTPPTSYSTEWSLTLIAPGQTSSTRRLQASSNRQSFTITPGTLIPDSTYSLKVTVTSLTRSQDALPASASQIITTLPAPMTITITRGNRQTSIYRQSVLDGSSSRDPGYPNLPLTYNWECKESSIPCDFMKDLKTTLSTLTLPPNTMKPDGIYIFTLTVSNSMRSGSASSYLETTSLFIPEVYLFTQAGYLNPYYIVFANNEVSDVPNIQLQWRITGGPFILNSPSNQRSITVKEDSLTYGSFYTFSLEVTLEDYSTISTITLYVNTPPLYGNLLISPNEGEELEVFTFVTSEWEDVENNYPIRYELYKDVNNLKVKVGDLNYSTVYQGVLSVGYEIYNYSRAYYIKAYDSLGAYSYTSFNVTVSPIPKEQVESIAYSQIESLNQIKEVIEDLDSIPYTVITLSDSLFRFETDDDNQDSRVQYVEDCLSLLSYYSEQDIETSRQAASVISTLERVTIQPQVVNEYSRNETVRMFDNSITKSEGGFKDNSIQQAVQIASNLYLSSDKDITISNSTKDSNSLSYYTLLNNLGLSVVKNNIRNQDLSEFSTDIYKVLYQRIGPSTMSSNFTLPDGRVVFPSSISEELFSQDLSPDSIIDISFIYSQQNSFTNYSGSFNESLYYIKNAGVMYVDAKHTGYENEVGDVVIESADTIELSNLTSPIEIYITVDYINITNITDQTPQCVYLNENSLEWEDTGCRFKEYLEEINQIVCECFHMSFYSVADFKRDLVGAAEKNRAEDLNISRLINAKIEDCYSVVIVMSVIVVIHILLSIYAFKLDIEDKKTPIQLIPENEGFKQRKFSKAKTASNLTVEAKQLNITQKETPKSDQINYDDDKPPKPLKGIYPVQTTGLYMVYQEVELQPKSFAQFCILNHSLLELKYIRNHTLSKIARLSLLFYSIYANIFVLGFFYTLDDDESFQEQVEQIIKAMKFNGQDVILFIYTKLVVLGPLILLKWLLSRDIKTLRRSVKNWIGIVLMLMGYLGSILGIILLGVNFQEYAVIKWMLKAVKATVIDVLILSHVNAILKACVLYIIQNIKQAKAQESIQYPQSPEYPSFPEFPSRI